MHPKLRAALAVIAGIVVSMAIVSGVEALGHSVYPQPADLDFGDPDSTAAYVASLPAGAFAFVLGAWALGTFGGGLVASWIARSKPHVYTGVIAGVMLLAIGANLMLIPHPGWFTAVAVVSVVIAAWLASRVASKVFAPRAPA